MRGRRAFAFDEKMRLDKGGLWNGADNRKAGRTEAYKKKKGKEGNAHAAATGAAATGAAPVDAPSSTVTE